MFDDAGGGRVSFPRVGMDGGGIMAGGISGGGRGEEGGNTEIEGIPEKGNMFSTKVTWRDITTLRVARTKHL